MAIRFEVLEKDIAGRLGRLQVGEKTVHTPALFPVVNPHLPLIPPAEMEAMGAGAIITNAYIFATSDRFRGPALDRGLHALLGFDGVIMTDSGAFQQSVYGDVEITNRETLEFHSMMYGMGREERRKKIAEVLALVELAEKAGVQVQNYSGGMKRRLLLARSLVNNPEILMLDEPTTGLDPHSRRAVWEKLNHLKFRNTTLILTTHYMEEAAQLCDRVALMHAGRILRQGRPMDFRAEPDGSGGGSFCPFCEGHEDKTPPKISALRQPGS